MSTEKMAPADPVQPGFSEERYSLRDMLAEVAQESQTGSLGAVKLHQKDIRKLFRAKPSPLRGPKG